MRLSRYNDAVRIACAVTVVVLSAGMSAQSPPLPCPFDKPVDEIIAEVHKAQSKNKSRNKNPLPSGICIGTWCLGGGKTPPTVPEPAPQVERPGGRTTDATGESSSKDPAARCDAPMELAIEAAHNVEVGDYYFEEKNYRAALLRYQEAAEQKPGDAAIDVRTGRVWERLGESQRAIEQYEAALKVGTPQKWIEEARQRLEHFRRVSPR